ncbi:hypothetical protein IKE83_02790 [Candidatus Saccharibacteria bacterium]|nr:hypothetical protein [Candidatus Saccharibacteria bacterium]
MDKKKLFFRINNLFIFITMVIAAITVMTYGSRGTRIDGTVTEHWQQIFTFTLLSNIFLGIVALIAAIMSFKNKPLTGKISTFYLAAASSAALTFLTVVLFLAPMRAMNGKNYFDMLLEPMFFLHFLNPVLSIITFIFLFPGRIKKWKPQFLSLIPVLIYGIAYVTCVVIIKIAPDFYGLTFGGRYFLVPLVFLLFAAIVFGISTLLTFLHNHYLKTTNKNNRQD